MARRHEEQQAVRFRHSSERNIYYCQRRDKKFRTFKMVYCKWLTNSCSIITESPDGAHGRSPRPIRRR